MNDRVTHILLVEDEQAHVDLVRRAFEANRERFNLSVAGSLAEARACLAETLPQIIIANLRLPDGLGTDLLPAEGEELTVPLVVMTAQGNEASAVEAIKAGAMDYLVKSEEVLADMPRIAERVLREWRHIAGRGVAERALVDSDNKYRLLFENAKDGIVIFDLDGTINDVNQETELMSGYSKEELIGSQSIIHLTPESAKLVEERMRTWLLGEKIPPVIELEGVRKDGSIAFIEGRTQFIHDHEGNTVGYQGIFRDISERRQAEAALRRFSQENVVMAEIGRIVNSSLDIEEVYQRIASQVGKLIHFDRLTISEINRENETAAITFISGFDIPELPIGRLLPVLETTSGIVARTMTTYLIQPRSEEELADLLPVFMTLYRAGLKSFMVVPLISQGEVVAVMRLQSYEANAYREDDVRVAEMVGAQVAGAIANAQLYAERMQAEAAERRRSQELAGLYEISRIFSEIGDFETKATAALERLAVLAGADWVTLRLPKEDDPGLHLVAASGPAVAEYAPIPVFTEAMAMSTAAFAEGRIVVIDDYANLPAASQDLIDLGMQSMVILPVKTRDRTVGLVTVISKDKSHFGPELVDLLTAVGEGLGVLLENSMLHEESEAAHRAQLRMAEVNSAMAEIGRIISSSLDIDEVYEAFAAELAKLVDFEWASVTSVDLNEQTLIATYLSGEPVANRHHGETFPLSGTFTGAVIDEPGGLVLDYSQGEDHTWLPGLDPFLEAGYRSFVGVRLVHHDRVMGALILASAIPGAYGDRELEIAARAARQIAGAIANASLYVKQREADEEIRDLAKFPSEDPNPVARISEDGTIMYANDAATEILEHHGPTAAESTLAIWQDLVKESLAGGTPKEVEIEYGPRIISYSLVPVPDAGYVNIYGRDITEAKEVERMKDEFISTVSHELRTPLTSIKGAAEILLHYKDEDPAVQAEFLNIIDHESDRLTRLINDVLDLARMESGEMQFLTSEVTLPGIIDTALDSTHSLAIQKNLTVEIALDKELPTVASDPDRLVQVITNLLSNAIKFTPGGGLIQVRARLLPDPGPETGTKMVEVSVSDNGVGIPDSEFEKIFHRFQQVSTTLSDRPQGTGLGLPISKEIVEGLGGAIWVESEPGKGSTFFFTIPLEQSPEQAAGESGERDKTTPPA